MPKSDAKSSAMPNVHSKSELELRNLGLAGLCKTVKVPLPRAPVPMARRFVQIVNAISVEAFSADDLSVLEFAVLQFLRREVGLDQISLATRIGVDRTNIGVIIDEMESRGLVERRIDPEDRRARIVQLTEAGLAMHNRNSPQTKVVRDKIFAPLTAREQELFYDLLERMIAANESYSQPGGGRRRRGR